jgi:Tol biopolymer transport system component
MNIQHKIEKYLKAASKPMVPETLFNELKKNVTVHVVEEHHGFIHRWFVPTGGTISRWRVAAVISIMVLLPLSYGATKLIKGFISIRQLPAIKLEFPYDGALSPDGKHFAAVSEDSGLVVIDTSTGQQRKLVEKCDGPVVWSADGSEIAVISRSGEKNTLLAVSSTTGKTRTLMEDPPYQLGDWSSDGRFISGIRATKPSDASVVLINLETRKETVLAEEWETSPRFSPKADCLTYVTQEGGRHILHLQNIDGTNHTQYRDFPGEISQLLWSPDGAYVVFKGTQKGINQKYTDLWAMRVQGNQLNETPFPVVPDVEQMTFFNWSQNGQLAYRTGFQLGGLFALPVDPQTGTATAAPRQVVRAGNVPRCFCCSPDGEQIAQCREEGGLSFISTRTGEKIRDLSLAGFQPTGRGTSWSPDGKYIAHAGMDKEKRGGVFLITVETGDVKLLVPQEEAAGNMTWSADGKSIAYHYKRDIYIVNVEDGEARRLTSPTDPNENKRTQFFIRPVFAPDGGSVAYIAGQKFDTILATTIDGKETREILRLKNGKSVNVFDWSPDGRYIVFTPGNNEIWCAPTNGGEPFQIADISKLGQEAFAWWPEWSPKGNEIIFGVVNEKFKYWVMENFLPAAEAGGQ